MLHSDLAAENITSLGELGVVGVLRIDSVVRGDTGNYTCTASNQLPQTIVITATSDPVPLIILGKRSYQPLCMSNYLLLLYYCNFRAS